MISRRAFIGSLAATALSQALPSTPDPELPPRQFSRFDRSTDSWIRIEPQTIKVGDAIWVHDPPPNGSDRVILIDGVDHPNRTMYSIYEIDPKTNQWVHPTLPQEPNGAQT